MSDSPSSDAGTRAGDGGGSGVGEPSVRLNKPVFYGSAIGVLLIAAWAILLPENAELVIGLLVEFIAGGFGWFYVLVAAAVLAFVLFLALSRYGSTKLGPDHSKPDYSNLSWAAMLFAAGIGTDLMFFSVAEPITQYTAPPVGEPGTVEAARDATVWTLFHYGLTGWGMYALMGIALAYFAYRRDLPLSVRSALYPIIGKRVFGRVGHAVDLAAVLGTIFGIATSLGIAVVLLNVGLDVMFGIPVGTAAQIALIAVSVVIATISAVSGVDKGIKRLSELNVIAALLLALFILVTGNTSFLLNALVTNLGDYLASFPTLTMETFAFEQTNPDVGEWMNLWTLFFWAWWIAWASFVGLFLARISRGRTIRQFVVGTLVIPFFYILFWISIFGNAALDSVRSGNTELADTAVNAPETGFYQLLAQYPWFPFLAGLATLTGLLFYVTSADSGALVMANLTSYRKTPRDDATPANRIFWAAATGLLTLGMLFVGGITTLQNATVIMGLPFAFVMVLVMFGLYKALRLERYRSESKLSSLPALLSGRSRPGGNGQDPAAAGQDWRDRLRRTMRHADEQGADQFLTGTATTVLQDVAAELRTQGVPTRVQRCTGEDAPEIEPGEERPEGMEPLELVAEVHATLPFVYRLVPRITGLPRYPLDGDGSPGGEPPAADGPAAGGAPGTDGNPGTGSTDDTDGTDGDCTAAWTDHHRVEVHLQGGGQGYNVMGYGYGQLVDDLLDQYEQHLELLRLEREAAP
ncbi:choline/glycine/proline betaine transport protein [Pseudonocardia ammonioxydans]|uniref:Choline/glycine/proline betaine transport protein n=1 Tax=Pseudonocardia ammonioxydans TaxID=260086 RepID=A0A1I4T5J3_PSUAM|nr:choline BCCT transporter BetT [Pseudonocardia ammonioxydans]SFM71887.1 choline/glycine/proline betaine transport protein [Pseudonocardia ammonioxydans]